MKQHPVTDQKSETQPLIDQIRQNPEERAEATESPLPDAEPVEDLHEDCPCCTSPWRI